MNEIIINIIGGVFAAIILSLGGYAFLIYKKKILKDDEKEILKKFQDITSYLSSENEVEKISAAILLRKFFDENSPLGKGGSPLKQEVCNVISGILRKEDTSHFQKILADTLRYVDSLENMDLQYTNLTNAFLGKKGLSFKNSDFYRANLTGVTFKPKNTKNLKIGQGVDLSEATFYETIIDGTNFSYSKLTNALFFNIKIKNTKFNNCDLEGVKFENCEFEDVTFDNCKNLPQYKYNVKKNIKKGKIFLSYPRIRLPYQDIFFENMKEFLINKNYEVIVINKQDEQNDAILRIINKKIEESDGLIAFNFKQFNIQKGIFRWWNKESKKEYNNIFLSTPWIILETAMAIKKGIPVYVISEINNDYDIFKQIIKEENLFYLSNIKYNTFYEIEKNLNKWLDFIKKGS